MSPGLHGPGLDDPLIAFAAISLKELYHVTDGGGRHFATGEAVGSLNPDIVNTEGLTGWNATGSIGNSASFGAERMSKPGMPGLSFFRNRVYDQATGRWTQEDPIGIAGGLNLYQFNGNNPASFIDPFGLCASATGPDSLLIDVNVKCPNGSEELQEIWAYRVGDEGQLTALGDAAATLTGGSSQFTPGDVQAAYGVAIAGGNVYTFAVTTADGGTVTDGAVTSSSRGIVMFRQDYWQSIQAGTMGRGRTCEIVGHEGVHLVQGSRGRPAGHPLNEPEARATSWGCR